MRDLKRALAEALVEVRRTSGLETYQPDEQAAAILAHPAVVAALSRETDAELQGKKHRRAGRC